MIGAPNLSSAVQPIGGRHRGTRPAVVRRNRWQWALGPGLLALVCGTSIGPDTAHAQSPPTPPEAHFTGTKADDPVGLIAQADALTAEGHYAEAEPLYRKALDIRRTTLGENHPDTAGSYDNVALNLDAQSRYAEAEPLSRKALDIRRATLGENHYSTATSYNNVAFNLHGQGRYAEAEPLYRKSLDIFRATLGENHSNTARSYSNVASNLDDQGRYAEAELVHRKALDIFRATLGENDPDTATGYNNVAFSLGQQGHYVEAEPLYRKALDIRRATLSEKHPDTATSYINVASNLNDQGRYVEAEPLYRKALDILRATLGENHPDTATSYNSVASNLNDQGRYVEAEPLYRKALDIRRAALGENHPVTAASYNNVALNQHAQGHYAEAEALSRKALDIARATLGENHPDTARGYSNVADNLRRQGHYAEADALYRKALDIARATLGENHPDTARGYNNAALNLNDQGHYAEAEPLYRKALDIRRAALGENHPETAQSYNNVADNLSGQGHYTESEHFAAQALTIAIQLRGRKFASDNTASDSKNTLIYIDSNYLVEAWNADAATKTDANTHAATALLAAQDLVQSASSQAMIRAAARQAAGSGALAATIREEQDLSVRAGMIDKRIIEALGSKTPAQADALRVQLERITARLAALDVQIDREFPAYRAIISPIPIAVDRIQEALAADEGLLLLLVDHKDIYSFGVGKTEIVWNRLKGGAPGVLAQIAHLRCQVDANACKGERAADEQTIGNAAHSEHFDLKAANELYAQLIQPVERALGGVRRLYATTSGPLGDLPLGTLVTTPPPLGVADDDPAVLGKAAWLADRYAITYLPAVSGLLLKGIRTPPSGAAAESFVGYGDPHLLGLADGCTRGIHAFSGAITRGLPTADSELIKSLCPLPETAGELRRMAATLHGSDGMVHLLDQATESALKSDPKLSQARIVAFATHGTLAGEGMSAGLGFSEPGLIFTPPPSPISLADGSMDDGVLTASEASLLSLTADWVILSACNTASAEGSSGGDGLSALSRGFLYAGAHGLLASHWRVADDSASVLTDETIRVRQSRPDLSRAQALQQAMKTVRTGLRSDGTVLPNHFPSFAHPADWAPFTEIANHDE